MPRLKLTKSVIYALPTSAKEIVYWDSGCPGFGVKVTPKGRKVFIVLYRAGGAGSRLRKYTIGPHGRVTLHQARTAALKIFAARTEGRDPAAEKQQARRRLVTDRVVDLVELFISEHVSKNRSAREISRLLGREVIPKWGIRSVHEIGKRQIIELVSEVTARGAPSAANKLLKIVKTFFGWCVGRAILDISPAAGLAAPAREIARDRLLDDNELARIVRAAWRIDGPYGGIVEILALTGQRREEVAQLTWDEVDLASQSWTLPASRTKNGKTHIVHLSQAAIAVLMRMPRRGRFVFSISGKKPFQGFSAAKREFDKLSEVLNHQSGTISGVAAVYQRHEFLAERKDALERWGAHITKLVKSRDRLVA